METTVDKLEALIHEAETKLDIASVELEVKLSKETGMQFNPVKLIKSIDDMKKELKELSQLAEAMKKDQEATKLLIEEKMQVVCKKLQDLDDRTGACGNNSSTTSDSVFGF